MQPIRRRIIEILKENGSATVAELAQQLGIAQVSVRHHLDILIGEDMVEARGVRRHDGAGRPSQVYALTPQAARLFPQRHDAIAEGLLEEVKAALPSEQVRTFFIHLANKTAGEAPAALPDQSLEDRLEEVTRFLTEKGYNARWEEKDGHYELHAYNCPYMGTADRHHELCLMDQELLRALVPGATRRQARALHGTTHCTYIIEPNPSQS
ncbi:MAG: ArsR family transcriptional regulator [Anaerolineae bacterium]|nr:ArsR family transcriptional regulator [Anaerolineae bacterium]